MNQTPKSAVYQLNYGILRNFIGKAQRLVMTEIIFGEEGKYMQDKVFELKKTIEAMPGPYTTDGQGGDAVVHLHYFRGSVDAWITERDSSEKQHQAFGKVCLTGDKSDAELGYVSIQELIDNGIEIDLHWTPTVLKDI